jgi:ATP-dependent Clp protease ATP-binding subunit ClpC
VFNLLLQIFDEGRLADAKGRKVDFRNTIIIMTSNVGSDLIKKDSGLGFSMAGDEVKNHEDRYQRMKDKVLTELKNVFKPEFLNRIDSTVVFRSLSREDIRKIVDNELRKVEKQLLTKGVRLEVTDAGKDWLGEKGYDPVFGARPLRRVIQDNIEDKLSEMLLSGEFTLGDAVKVDANDEGLVIEPIREPAAVG